MFHINVVLLLGITDIDDKIIKKSNEVILNFPIFYDIIVKFLIAMFYFVYVCAFILIENVLYLYCIILTYIALLK